MRNILCDEKIFVAQLCITFCFFLPMKKKFLYTTRRSTEEKKFSSMLGKNFSHISKNFAIDLSITQRQGGDSHASKKESSKA